MNTFLSRLKAAWSRLFFWHQSPSGSGEIKPETHHDHALVLAVTEKQSVPAWNQWRFFTRVLPAAERRLFFIAFTLFCLSVIAGTASLLWPHVSEVPTLGGTMTEAVVGTPKLINPLYATLNDVDRDLSSLVFSGLFRVNDKLEAQPDLAEQYQWLEDGKTVQVKIRSDARFHDGQPVTADDVVFTYQSVKSPAWRSPLAGVYKGVKVVRVDDQTVQFQLDQARPTFLQDLTLGILPAHIWEDVPEGSATIAEANIKPIGSGPYHVASFKRDNRGAIITYDLEAFPQYYGLKPLIENWQFKFFAERTGAIQALRTGQADSFAFATWSEAEEVAHSTIKDVKIELPLQQTIAFFNLKDNLLKDQTIREALSLAVDRNELQTLIGSQARLISSPFPGIEVASSTTSDLNAARAMLEKAGWKLAPNATVRQFVPPPKPVTTTVRGRTTTVTPTSTLPNASSTPLEVHIDVPDQQDLVRVAELLQRRWSLLGAKVTITTQPSDTLRRQATQDRNYQVILWNVLLSPSQDISLFWSSASAGNGQFNWSNLSNRDIDTDLAKITSVTNTQMLLQSRQKLAQDITALTPALFLMRPSYAYLVNQRVHGTHDIVISRSSDRFLNMMDWYLNTHWRWN